MAATKTFKLPRINKTAWILAQGDRPAATVVEAGKAEGITLTTAFVYAARGKARKAEGSSVPRTRGGQVKSSSQMSKAERALQKLASKGAAEPSAKTPATVKRGPGRPPKSVPSATRGPGRPSRVETQSVVVSGRLAGGDEAQLAALIVRLGTGRAEEIFERVKQALERLSF